MEAGLLALWRSSSARSISSRKLIQLLRFAFLCGIGVAKVPRKAQAAGEQARLDNAVCAIVGQYRTNAHL